MNSFISVILLLFSTWLMIFSFNLIIKSYIISDNFMIERNYYIILINIIINLLSYIIITNLLPLINEFINIMWIYKIFYISIIITNIILIYKIFFEKVFQVGFWYHDLRNYNIANKSLYVFAIFNILYIILNYFLLEINEFILLLKDIILYDNFIQWLVFFLIIVFTQKLIWFLISSRFSKIYVLIPLTIFRTIIIIFTIYIVILLWNEVKGDIFLEDIYRFFFFISLNILFQLFLIWNINDVGWMSEDYIVDSYEMKIHKLLIYYLNILTLIFIYIYKLLIKLLIVISLISFIVYIIIEYNLEEKIYYDIYIPYFEYYKYIYINLIKIFIYLILSLIISKKIYDQLYGKMFIAVIYAKYILNKDNNGYIFFFILYIVMFILILIYFFFFDIIINNINLSNLGLFLDIMEYIIKFIYDIIINFIIYFWKAIKLFIKFMYIVIELFKDNN